MGWSVLEGLLHVSKLVLVERVSGPLRESPSSGVDLLLDDPVELRTHVVDSPLDLLLFSSNASVVEPNEFVGSLGIVMTGEEVVLDGNIQQGKEFSLSSFVGRPVLQFSSELRSNLSKNAEKTELSF